ncbi:MAG TPA: hypothetical protein VKQ32_22415 [Polyangia bacterium]|nr:hypothetical protein [Polyangia bacterium]
MTGRAIAATVTVILFSAGCTTTTAHRLVLIDNPLRDQAIACEASCRQAATWKRDDCSPFGGEQCHATGVDPHKYATCLDNCPGARATDGGSCPTPDPGAVCVETNKANAGGIIGGVLAGVGIGLLILVVVVLGEIASAPILIL